jgi:hypothetical protein
MLFLVDGCEQLRNKMRKEQALSTTCVQQFNKDLEDQVVRYSRGCFLLCYVITNQDSTCTLYGLHYITFIQRTGMCSQSCKLTSAVRIRTTTTKKSYPYIFFKPNMSCLNTRMKWYCLP